MTTTQPSTMRANGTFVDVNGVRTYCEASGDGDPLLLLHGGFCSAESFDAQTAELSKSYRVYVPEQFAHGRTRDIEGPLTYEVMAQHTIALMEALAIDSAHVGGWSDGALVALLVALRRPKLVRKLIMIDQYVELDRAPEWCEQMTETWAVDTMPPFLRDGYRALSPDGAEHLPVVFTKLKTLWLSPTGVELSDLARVTAPTLIVAGDSGILTLSHLAEIAAALPAAQIAVVPGTSHALVWEKPHVVNQLIGDFLADAPAPKSF